VRETIRINRAVRVVATVAAPIRAEKVEQYLAKMASRKRGGSARNRQKYLKAVRGFTRWLATTGKLQRDPLAANPRRQPG
jgi:site-specific recombinase XerC